MIIAETGGSRPVNSKELCQLQGEKARYLEPIMQCLVRGHILRSIRGPKGGYVLMRERRKITLGEIAVLMHALEVEKVAKGQDNPVKTRVIQPLCAQLEKVQFDYLNQLTLEELCHWMGNQHMLSSRESNDFII